LIRPVGEVVDVLGWVDESGFESPGNARSPAAKVMQEGVLLLELFVLNEEARRPERLVRVRGDDSCSSPRSPDSEEAMVTIPSDDGTVEVAAGESIEARRDGESLLIQNLASYFFGCDDGEDTSDRDCGFAQVLVRRIEES
jgi:hypothetical protein